jgi:aminoglycoside 3-N-acetyltransferase
VTKQLLELGIKQGGVLVVHCAFSKVKPIEGGPLGLIRALQEAIGVDGTLVIPSMTDDDDHPFDPKTTHCLGTGVEADTLLPEVQPG